MYVVRGCVCVVECVCVVGGGGVVECVCVLWSVCVCCGGVLWGGGCVRARLHAFGRLVSECVRACVLWGCVCVRVCVCVCVCVCSYC